MGEKKKSGDKGLDNFLLSRKNVKNPTTETLLAEFRDIVKGIIALPSGETFGFVSELTDIPKDILAVLGIPQHYFNDAYLFNSNDPNETVKPVIWVVNQTIPEIVRSCSHDHSSI
ncbi:MAG: hypothetical protein EHM38_10110 [Geobacteraceae bacterium]|nr:MAG: hypothetical protein EHM38_10110 [Geobacteraceae bacterium]